MAASVDPAATTNYQKFHTANPIARRMIGGFFDRLRSTIEPMQASSVLDAGCGEGETVARLRDALPKRIVAIDVDPTAVEFTARRFPKLEVSRASVYELPFDDDAFDLVLCLEVLEHLDEPDRALAELVRVSSRHLVVSVPDEPWFRLGSLARGKHVRRLGNHPEHVNHWSPRTFRPFLEAELRLVRVERAFPWLVARGLVGAARL